MKVVIAGGTGQVGTLLRRGLIRRGYDVVVLSRSGFERPGQVAWDGRTLGPWANEIDGADVVVNLAGRSVNCRYTESNLREMRDSRVDSTRVVGEAIARAASPPRVWLQMSTATIYAHGSAPNDEASGVIGGGEPGAPGSWARSVEIAEAWEAAQREADTPHTRKVALRSAMVMSPDEGGVFDVLRGLVRAGLGGAIAGGAQYVSWIHEEDFVRAVVHLVEHAELEGPVNLAAPNPLPQRELMAGLRRACGRRLGLPATAAMAEVGAFFLRTDTELVLKSRRVLPGRLLASGFEFEHPSWPEAARELLARGSERVADDTDERRADSRSSAATKGAVVGLAAFVAFYLALRVFALAHGLDSVNEPEENRVTSWLIASAALVPTLLAGTGLGWLAGQLRRSRVLALSIVALPMPLLVFAATFGLLSPSPAGLLFGAAIGFVFGLFTVPIALAAALVLAWWVRPRAPEPTPPQWALGALGSGST